MSIFLASALGGLGAAASILWLGFAVLGLLTICAFLGYSWRRYSSVAARVAWVFIFGMMFILQPWYFINPPKPSPFEDFDGFDSLVVDRLVVGCWIAVIIFAIGCHKRAVRHQKSGPDADHKD